MRLALTGAAAFAVLGGGTAFACLGTPLQHGSPVADAARHGMYRLGSQKAGWLTSTAKARPTALPSTPAASSHTAAPAHRTARPSPTATATAKQTPRPVAPQSSPAAPAAGSGSSTGDAVQQVLALINKNRTAQGLAPYTLSSGLNSSAAAHNQVMASGCGLSHQCPGEAAFGDRETSAGVHWTSAGENIGEGGGVGSSDAGIAASAVGLNQMMLDEKARDDGHRKNILSSSFTRVGIAVYRDSSGTVWLTQDFAN